MNEDTLWAGGPYDPANPDALEALPRAWPNGSVKGLRARCGFELDIRWKESKLPNVTVRSFAGGSCRLRYGAVTPELTLAEGQSAQWDGIQ